jgi:DNA mismatch endonuclease (patch repair protein)
MAGNRRRDSKPELRLRSALHGAGFRFRVDLPIRVANLRPIRPDVVFTRSRVAVFVDGCFWHGCPEHGRRPQTNATYWAAKIEINEARDRQQTDALERAGWTVVRVWEHENPEAAVALVATALAPQAASERGASARTENSVDATA